MAALRQEHRYGLSCVKINKIASNKTLYHVKLTDTAIRTLEAYQNLKESLPNQPAICFKGNQGYIKIPASTAETPDALRVFSFYLSSDSKDKPQASFDCIHQYVSGEGRELLAGKGSIQDKITVCATDDSYQMTRERMSQVEKDIWSRAAIEIKPGPSKCVKVQRKQGSAVSGLDGSNRQSPSNKRSAAPSSVAHRPLRERIIHLLALKPYRKPDLLLWLERERASLKDKADLTSVLEEIAKLNPKDLSYTLKEEHYRHVQRDWPGFVEEEKQLIHRLLARKLPPLHGSQVKSLQSNPSLHKAPGDSPSQLSPAKHLSVKRPLPSDSQVLCQTPKKQRLLDHVLPLQSPSNGEVGPGKSRSSAAPGNTSVQTNTEFERTHSHAQGSPTGPYLRPTLSQPSAAPSPQRAERAPPAPSPRAPQANVSVCAEQRLVNGLQRKKKSKKHKDKERERLKPNWIETSPDQKQNQENINDQEGDSTSVTHASDEELPDYLIKYRAIAALEQRQQYKDDFCAEYDEYRSLHERIGTVTEMFVQLGSKINTLSPGTQEYKLMEDQILQKYKKYKKKFPGYREEKKRCEYLHQKLSHIKGLILDYDQTQTPT
ncbi:RNA polymerase II elongation factor ELL2 [Gadus chalcogrammus]|uniref:RNA polymerase II elongation factor ELL2 n=1 Tax=Gadus chalcogrammus TaxID=1042646 RepID=UPI0024C4B608|nr:RNA polymerase II elongation factor ELL2 [Gadus chalcogrammus]